MKIYILILFCLLLPSCLTNKKAVSIPPPTQPFEILSESLNLYDSARARSVPVALYLPKTSQKIRKQKIVIFSHGYGANRGGDNRAYSYLTEHLAAQGYVVASIQHELPTDDLIPATGIPKVVRRPFWERGCQNILFVLREMKKSHPTLDYKHLILIGHSNGADMTALFAQQYPNRVDKIIALDNRRMALPRTNHPSVYSLRSSDQPADEGVLPTYAEQIKFGIKVITLSNTIHNDMNNRANAAQRKEINEYMLRFLND